MMRLTIITLFWCVRSAFADRAPTTAELATAPPRAVLVSSEFSHIGGLYEKQAELHDYYPVYYSKTTKYYLWHDISQGEWVSSDQLNATRYTWRLPSGHKGVSPAGLGLSAMKGNPRISRISTINDVTPTASELAKAPRAVLVISEFSNIDGVYNKQAELHDYYPVYYSEKTKHYLWHDISQGEWVSSEQLKGDRYIWRLPSGHKGVSPAGLGLSAIKGRPNIRKIVLATSEAMAKENSRKRQDKMVFGWS